jgi:hypothetical protein
VGFGLSFLQENQVESRAFQFKKERKNISETKSIMVFQIQDTSYICLESGN